MRPMKPAIEYLRELEEREEKEGHPDEVAEGAPEAQEVVPLVPESQEAGIEAEASGAPEPRSQVRAAEPERLNEGDEGAVPHVARGEVEERLEAMIDPLQWELEEIGARLAVLEERADAFFGQAQVASVGKELDGIRARLEELSRNAGSAMELKRLQKDIARLQRSVEELKERIEAAREETGEAEGSKWGLGPWLVFAFVGGMFVADFLIRKIFGPAETQPGSLPAGAPTPNPPPSSIPAPKPKSPTPAAVWPYPRSRKYPYLDIAWGPDS